MAKENDNIIWIREIIKKYEKTDEETGSQHGMEVALAIFGKALLEKYLREEENEKRK